MQISQFSDYGPNGLQIEGKSAIKTIAFAVSATKDSIEKAIEKKADALIVHHGLFWKYKGACPIIGQTAKRIIPLIKNDINLFAYHLPLDAHPKYGNAATLAEKIGMTKLESFGEYKKMPLGIKGKLSNPIPAKDLQVHLEKVLNHSIIIASENPERVVNSLGIITGGANNDWTQAVKDNLDAYLTGEISEYNWHDSKEAGIHMFAGGHHATEIFGVQALKEHLKQKYPDLDYHFIDSENPA